MGLLGLVRNFFASPPREPSKQTAKARLEIIIASDRSSAAQRRSQKTKRDAAPSGASGK
jgi:septum formation topological specificity factor MinE